MSRPPYEITFSKLNIDIESISCGWFMFVLNKHRCCLSILSTYCNSLITAIVQSVAPEADLEWGG